MLYNIMSHHIVSYFIILHNIMSDYIASYSAPITCYVTLLYHTPPIMNRHLRHPNIVELLDVLSPTIYGKMADSGYLNGKTRFSLF